MKTMREEVDQHLLSLTSSPPPSPLEGENEGREEEEKGEKEEEGREKKLFRKIISLFDAADRPKTGYLFLFYSHYSYSYYLHYISIFTLLPIDSLSPPSTPTTPSQTTPKRKVFFFVIFVIFVIIILIFVSYYFLPFILVFLLLQRSSPGEIISHSTPTSMDMSISCKSLSFPPLPISPSHSPPSPDIDDEMRDITPCLRRQVTWNSPGQGERGERRERGDFIVIVIILLLLFFLLLTLSF